jgi:hypothetical protein
LLLIHSCCHCTMDRSQHHTIPLLSTRRCGRGEIKRLVDSVRLHTGFLEFVLLQKFRVKLVIFNCTASVPVGDDMRAVEHTHTHTHARTRTHTHARTLLIIADTLTIHPGMTPRHHRYQGQTPIYTVESDRPKPNTEKFWSVCSGAPADAAIPTGHSLRVTFY